MRLSETMLYPVQQEINVWVLDQSFSYAGISKEEKKGIT